MKKILSTIIAFCGIAATLTSCGDKPIYDESGNRTSSAKIDSALVGTWSNGSGGYSFDDNGKVSLIMDYSSSMGFGDDGSFDASGQHFDKEEVIVEDDIIRIFKNYTDPETETESEVDFLVMKCKGEIDTETYNGSYEILSGALTQFIATRLNVSAEILTIEADFSDDGASLTVLDFLDYDAENGSLKMSNPNLSYVDENADSVNYTYTLDGDHLTMVYVDTGGQEEYDRVNEN